GKTEEYRRRECDAAARKPSRDTGDQGDEYRTLADPEHEAAGPHEFIRCPDRRQYRAHETDDGGPQGDARWTVAIDEQSIEYCQQNVGQADDGGEVADLRLRETALAAEQIRDRADRIGLVVTAKDGEGRQPQHPPAQGRRGAVIAGSRAGGRWRVVPSHARYWVIPEVGAGSLDRKRSEQFARSSTLAGTAPKESSS